MRYLVYMRYLWLEHVFSNGEQILSDFTLGSPKLGVLYKFKHPFSSIIAVCGVAVVA